MAIHERIIEMTCGLAGIRDVNLLFSVAERPKTSIMGQEMYPDLFLKAAVYLESLAQFHVFSDANKRSSITVCALFLRANGVALDLPESETFTFVLEVAKKKHSLAEIADWLKKHSI